MDCSSGNGKRIYRRFYAGMVPLHQWHSNNVDDRPFLTIINFENEVNVTTLFLDQLMRLRCWGLTVNDVKKHA